MIKIRYPARIWLKGCFRTDMGSHQLFLRFSCPQCGDSSFLHAHDCDEPPVLCGDCLNANAVAEMRSCIIFKHLQQTVSVPESIMDTLPLYLLPMHDTWAMFRKEYLRIMLLQRGGVYLGNVLYRDVQLFRKLTYCSNGMAGSVSEHGNYIC